MLPELGQITLIGALLVALTMGILPMIGASTGNQRLMRIGQTGAAAQFFLIACSFIILTWAFIVQDFSVEYVARNSNSQLPMEYRFSAVWGAHEGSLLLWELILCMWTFAVALFSKKLPDDFRARTLAVLGPGDRVVAQAGDEIARFLLVAAQPLGEPVARGGPFVMNTREEVLQAFDDYRNNRF